MSGLVRVRRLEVWREAVMLARDLYELSSHWPNGERYGLVSQLRRAGVSVSANLAEGAGRDSPAEAARFGRIALGSLYEVDSLLEVASLLQGFAAADVELRERIVSLAKRMERYIAHPVDQVGSRVRDGDRQFYAAEGCDHDPLSANQETR